jgi:hypothetical protein
MRSQIKQSQADLRFLTEAEWVPAARLGRPTVTCSGSMREPICGWRAHRAIGLRSQTCPTGRPGPQGREPGGAGRRVRHHGLAAPLARGHARDARPGHLGHPKTPKYRRTMQLAEGDRRAADRHVDGRSANDFVFTTPTGPPVHGADFYERVWSPSTAVCARPWWRRSGSTTWVRLRRLAGRRPRCGTSRPGSGTSRLSRPSTPTATCCRWATS